MSLAQLYAPSTSDRIAEIRAGLLAASDALVAIERAPTRTNVETLVVQTGGVARAAAGLLHSLPAA